MLNVSFKTTLCPMAGAMFFILTPLLPVNDEPEIYRHIALDLGLCNFRITVLFRLWREA